MKILVGLGNPGEKYAKTRHNAGFRALDALAKSINASNFEFSKKFSAEIAEIDIKSEKTILVKPQTYMNLSGKSVSALMRFFKTPTSDLIVVYDDVDLELGTIRIRQDGSSGGHRGIESVIREIGKRNFWRVRIGVLDRELGKQEIRKIGTDEYVLGKFTKKEEEVLGEVVNLAVAEISKMVENGFSEKTIGL